jgi:hypothetical protein
VIEESVAPVECCRTQAINTQPSDQVRIVSFPISSSRQTYAKPFKRGPASMHSFCEKQSKALENEGSGVNLWPTEGCGHVPGSPAKCRRAYCGAPAL